MNNAATFRRLDEKAAFTFSYSICTLVTDPVEYGEMQGSFVQAGFTHSDCEYLVADNTGGNRFDAYQSINRFLREAKGEYVIICHQDVLLEDSRRDQLDRCITGIEAIDPEWAVLANCGGINAYYAARNLNQWNGDDEREKVLPIRAVSVDEHFMVVKNSANLAASHDLSGFHFYGADICLMADILGYRTYIIDFVLTHKSRGTIDHRFYAAQKVFENKYNRALRDRCFKTTVTRVCVSGNSLGRRLFSKRLTISVIKKFDKYFRPKKIYKP